MSLMKILLFVSCCCYFASGMMPITGFCQTDADCIDADGDDTSCCAQWNVKMPIRVCKSLRDEGQICKVNSPDFPLLIRQRNSFLCPCHSGFECHPLEGKYRVGKCRRGDVDESA
ncbi:Hypp4070 [Branchiostoma lanceolatum]|uniref:Hypp4070 protein n=1 Tax=Branchiostoma lanceolatum TaxID=7740 RepID=A0A8K0A6P9_BRALA|nr:Hypp4070 [Branchiostoma lanceolatum]